MPIWWPFPVAAAFVLSALLTPWVARLAVRLGVVDRPNKERKIHDRAIPLMGGLAIYLAFAAATIAVLVFTDHFTAGEMNMGHILGFLAGGAVLMIGGYLDDKFDLPPKFSIIAPLVAIFIALASGIDVEKITNPLGGAIVLPAVASTIFAFMWLFGMTYTTKLLDGMDGLAGGVTAVGTVMIAALALSVEYFQPDVALLALIFLAALIGFLLWNWNPARVFLGEGGSTFIGYALGVLAIISGSKVATALLVMGIPALDVVIVMSRRALNGRNPFTSADRLHFHHLLLRMNISQRQAVTLYCTIALCFGMTALMFESWQKIVALGFLALMLLVGVQCLARKSP